MPQAVEPLRKYESRLGPLNIKAKLDVEPAARAPRRASAKLKLTGRIAGIDTTLDASGSGTLSNPGAAVLHMDGRFDAEDGRIIAAFSGLDQLVNMDRRPARLTVVADGAAERSFRVDGKFAAGDISASAAGTWKVGGDGTLDVALRAADAKLPRRAPATVPVDLRGKLAVDGSELKFTDLAGRVAGTAVKGRLAVGLGAVPRLDGRIEADQVDGAEVVAILPVRHGPRCAVSRRRGRPNRSSRRRCRRSPAGSNFAPAACNGRRGLRRATFRAPSASQNRDLRSTA